MNDRERLKLRKEGLKEKDISVIACTESFVSKFTNITSDEYIHCDNYKHRKDKRLTIQNKRLSEMQENLMEIFGREVYFEAIERLNFNLNK